MKKFVFLLMFWPISAMALCLEFYFDKDGQSQSLKCGSNRPEIKCSGETYWDGTSCQKVEIIEICKKQGGTWKQVQLRVAQLADAFESGALARKRAIINMCACPEQKVWDGQKCRSDIPTAKQCTGGFGDKSVRMTEEFFGSEDCPRVSQ
ncbi:hypothetical protein J6P92_04095 [bacterium]|nr:hypothetical protein [bacterium]